MYFWLRKTLWTSQNSRYPSSRYRDSTVFLKAHYHIWYKLCLYCVSRNVIYSPLPKWTAHFLFYVSIDLEIFVFFLRIYPLNHHKPFADAWWTYQIIWPKCSVISAKVYSWKKTVYSYISSFHKVVMLFMVNTAQWATKMLAVVVHEQQIMVTNIISPGQTPRILRGV